MKLYFTTAEVARQLGVNASHVRFLEKEFPELRPQTNARGARRYTADDLELLRRIIYLTKECNYTLEGARQQLRTSRQQQASGLNSPLEERLQLVDNLQQIRQFLVELKEQL